MALQILPKTHKYPELTADNIQEIEQLAQALDEINRLTYDEMEALEARVTSAEGSITTNTTNIATNTTNIATNVTDIGTNVTDITNLENRIEPVNMKVFSGTTDADSQTSFAHGITESKICGGLSSIYNGTVYVLNDIGSGAYVAADAHRIYVNGSNVILDNVGSNLQSKAYRVILFYVD